MLILKLLLTSHTQMLKDMMMQYHRERPARATNHSDVDDRACEGSLLIAPVMEQVHFYAWWSVRVLYGGTYYL